MEKKKKKKEKKREENPPTFTRNKTGLTPLRPSRGFRVNAARTTTHTKQRARAQAQKAAHDRWGQARGVTD